MLRFFIVIFIILSSFPLFAGELSFSLMGGVADDRGLVKNRLDYLNLEMRSVESSTAGSKVTEIESYYMPVLSAAISYIHSRFYFSMGWEYSSYIYLKPEGEISTPAYSGNEIELSMFRHTIPVNIGFVIPYDRDNLFYFAGGINFTYSMLKITQSNPGSMSSLGGESNSYESFLGGFQFKFGAKSRIKRNLSFILEVTSYMGKTRRSESLDELSKADTQMTVFEITAGVDYRIRIF